MGKDNENHDSLDELIEKKTGFKKVHERIGSASYIQWSNVIGADQKIRKVEMKRVDLNVIDAHLAKINAYKSETLCPYGGSKCAVSLYSHEAKLFMKKLKVMQRIWVLDRIKRWLKKIFRRTE